MFTHKIFRIICYIVWSDPKFLESPGKVSGPESCFAFALSAFTIKVSIILKVYNN